MKHILIAGIGNIFRGDDAFGCEVARQLRHREWPEPVAVIDFGVRSFDLAYALTDNYAAIVLVNATPHGQSPGTVSLIEPDWSRLDKLERAPADPHAMNPVAALRLAQSAGGVNGKIYLLGCEPAALETGDGRIGLSEPVQAAVPRAIQMIENLVADFLGKGRNSDPVAVGKE